MTRYMADYQTGANTWCDRVPLLPFPVIAHVHARLLARKHKAKLISVYRANDR